MSGLSHKQIIETIVGRHFGRSVFQIKSLVRKNFTNYTFIVTTKSARYVIRMHNDASYDQFKKEQWCIAQAYRVGIPVPKVVAVGNAHGFSYMLHEYISGKNGADRTTNKVTTWRTLGRYAKAIHSIPVKGWGEELIDPKRHLFGDSWSRFLNYNIKSLTSNDELLKLKVITHEQSKKIKQIFRSLKIKRFTFGLNHNDLRLQNTVISNNGVVYLLDWGSAEAHIVPHFDLAAILDDSFKSDSQEFQAFLEGYGMSKKGFQNVLPDIESLMLLTRFDKLRWALDRKPEKIKDFTRKAKKIVHRKLNDF